MIVLTHKTRRPIFTPCWSGSRFAGLEGERQGASATGVAQPGSARQRCTEPVRGFKSHRPS